MDPRPPVPPFTVESARTKVQAAEDAWNSRDPHRVSLAYTADSQWRNRSEFLTGRPAIVEFLSRKLGAGAGLCTAQGAVGLHREPDRRPVPLRVARRRRPVVALVRQRELGVRPGWIHEPARGQHQRRPYRRGRAHHVRPPNPGRAPPLLTHPGRRALAPTAPTMLILSNTGGTRRISPCNAQDQHGGGAGGTGPRGSAGQVATVRLRTAWSATGSSTPPAWTYSQIWSRIAGAQNECR